MLANEFELPGNVSQCLGDFFMVFDIDTTISIPDKVAGGPGAARFCGDLSQDYTFTLTPRKNEPRFRFYFQANPTISA